MYGWELLQRSQVLFEAGKIIQAEEVLTELPTTSRIAAWNRRAFFITHQSSTKNLWMTVRW